MALGLLALTNIAHAQADIQKAKESYARAEEAMNKGDYAQAVTGYTAAYEVTKDPVLFFKIASAHDKGGRCATALPYYERYLAEGKPDERFAALTRERIETCKAAGKASPAAEPSSTVPAAGDSAAPASATATEAPAPAASTAAEDVPAAPADDEPAPMADVGKAPPSFADQRTTWQRNAGWLSVGIAVTFTTAGAVLAMSASSREEDIDNLIRFRYPSGEPAQYTGTTRDRYEELVDEGEELATYARIAFGAAGVAAAAATVFFIMDVKTSPDEARTAIAPMASPDSLGVSASLRF